MTRLVGLAVLVVSCALLVVATPALAGKGGKKATGGTATATSTATVTATPNPASAWGARVYLSGCGFEVKPAQVRVAHSAGYTETFYVGVWSPGCLDTAYFLTREPGTYTISVYQTSGTKRKATTVLKASTVLTVVG